MSARALFAGGAAWRALAGGCAGAIEIVLKRCAYARLGQDWLALAEPDLPFGPLSIAVQGLGRLHLRPGIEVRPDGGRLLLGDDAVRLERVRERRSPALGRLAPAGPPAIRAAGAIALAGLPRPGARLRDGMAALAAGRVEDAVGLLAGFGAGLTPAGDDVLTGYAAARRALGALPAPHRLPSGGRAPLSALSAERASALGLAYLRAAELGELPDPGALLLRAIWRGSREEVRLALPPLCAWGASSGAALGWGITAAVDERLGLHSSEEQHPARTRSARALSDVQRDRSERVGRDEQPELAPGDPPASRIGLHPDPGGPVAGVPAWLGGDLVSVDAQRQLPRPAGAVDPVLDPELELGAGYIPDADEARPHAASTVLSAPPRGCLRKGRSERTAGQPRRF